MPVFSWVQADLEERGPRIDVILSQVPTAQEAIRTAGEDVADSMIARALIDTGAGTTAVDASVVKRLQLQPVGTRSVVTASGTSGRSASAYAVQFQFPGAAVFQGTVVEAELGRLGADMLIGRDMLSHAVLVYVGTSGQCTISF